jgi:hypothetical protein
VFSRDIGNEVSWRRNENWEIDELPHASQEFYAPYVGLNEAIVKDAVSDGCCVLVESKMVP